MISLNNLAFGYGAVGDYQTALQLYKQCYELRKKVLGEEHPDTLSSLHKLAYSYYDNKKYNQSLEADKKCYELRCKVLGEEHPDTLQSLNNLVCGYRVLGQFNIALELFDKLYNIHLKNEGETAINTLKALSNIAYTYFKADDNEKALKYCEQILGYGAELNKYIVKKIVEIFNANGLTDRAEELKEKYGL